MKAEIYSAALLFHIQIFTLVHLFQLNNQPKAGGPGIVYFLLSESHSFPILVVLSLVFVFTSEGKDWVHSQQNKVRELNQETTHSLQIKFH